ncbi:patatin-like phospholipase family protein [Hymenobacter daeguensis]
MDVNAEIAARATAVLVLMQDWLAGTYSSAEDVRAWRTRLVQASTAPLADAGTARVPLHLLLRASELLNTDAAPRPATDPGIWAGFRELAHELVRHLERQQGFAYLLEAPKPPPPAAWRRALRRLLYREPTQREEICKILGTAEQRAYFEPLLIQLLLQKEVLDVLSAKGLVPRGGAHAELVERFLKNPELVADGLDAASLAVPFTHVLGRELEEIYRRRRARLLGSKLEDEAPTETSQAAGPAVDQADQTAGPDLSQPFGPGPGPFGLAETGNLLGLALSGGGIRSATFALGAVQALARRGWLPRLDYLSTVSGGGYLGGWLVTLIQRLGSVRTTQQRLDPSQTANPMAEENRPVRWLRSFSNYLTPEASIFSTDAWTLGTTWLRNALLNQFILVLFLCSVLLLPHFLLARWVWWGSFHAPYALGMALLLLAVAAALAGWQQRWYDRPASEASPDGPGWLAWLPIPGILPAVLLLAGWHLAAYAYFQPPQDGEQAAWFWRVSGVLCGWLLLVAAFGRYHLCFRWKRPHAGWAWLVIGLTSALASGAGAVLLLALAGYFRHLTSHYANLYSILNDMQDRERLAVASVMVFGPALAVEALGLALTGRMALLGRAFTDERREWWGRLGAQAHLTVLAWVLLAGYSLLLPYFIKLSIGSVPWPTTVGAWVALVGGGVKLAQSGRTPAQASAGPKSATASATDLVARVAPYLFIVGLLGLLVWTLDAVLPAVALWFGKVQRLPIPLPTDAYHYPHWGVQLALIAGLFLLSWLLAWRVGVNEFSLHHFYKNRLLRAYLGASRARDERQANPYTDFDTADDLHLCHLRHHPLPNPDGTAPPPYSGPLPLFNTALNVTRGGELAKQNRKAESFVFSPLYAGFDFARMVPVQHPDGRYAEYGFRPTHAYAYPAPGTRGDADARPRAGGVHVGTVMAISGAAANPNMGYHSSPVTAFLLTLFNVRLGWWMGNPRRARWQSANPKTGLGYLLKDLFGRATPTDDYVCLSDGGHFDNLGLYELVRRRCRYIIVCDGEEDADLRFEALANAIRRCRIDFGVEIDIDLTALRNRDAQKHTPTHAALGTILYPDDPTPGTLSDEGLPPIATGHLLYLKATLTGHEPVDVLEYAHQNPVFPHQSTGDQFFSEDQFESYRQLGYFAASHLFPPADLSQPLPDPAPLFDAARFRKRYPIAAAPASP